MPLDPPHDAARTRERLFARLRESARRQREYFTVRREAAAWQGAGPGALACTLHAGALACVRIVRLEDGAEPPWSAHAAGQELLVLDGALASGDPALPALGRHDLLIRERGAPGAWQASGPSRIYLRERCVALEALPPLEARWWLLAGRRPRAVAHARRGWHPAGPGVNVCPLWGDAGIVSMLVRFAPGAGVADHHHAVDEDCLVLEGEMFLGDILLRAGDYQLAPAGGGHFGETSDVGVLFYFHGAVDPVLNPVSGPAAPAASSTAAPSA
jgi:hypothetical protein